MHRENTYALSRKPLGRVVRKGYSSRYLAAQNCTTSSFRATYQFRRFFCSTTYNQMDWTPASCGLHYQSRDRFSSDFPIYSVKCWSSTLTLQILWDLSL